MNTQQQVLICAEYDPITQDHVFQSSAISTDSIHGSTGRISREKMERLTADLGIGTLTEVLERFKDVCSWMVADDQYVPFEDIPNRPVPEGTGRPRMVDLGGGYYRMVRENN